MQPSKLIKLMAVLFLAVGCSCCGDDDDGDKTNDCALTFTNNPGAAFETIEAAEATGAVVIPGDLEELPTSTDASVEQEAIEIFFCSDVIAFDNTDVGIEGTLDLARRGKLSIVQARRVK